MPGEFQTLTAKQIRKALAGTEGVELSEEQLKIRGALMGRLQEKTSRQRGARSRSRSRSKRGRKR